jgi:hypothetical protein
MLKIVKIGDVELNYPLWWLETYQPRNVKATAFNTIGGSKVVWESYRRDNSSTITLSSEENGWVHQTTLQRLSALANEPGLTFPIYTSTGEVLNCRFIHEEEGFFKYEPLWEGSEWFKVTIKLGFQ